MTLIYVDVSHHDWDRHGGQLDWAKVKAATSPVMCARATYGDPSGYSPDSRHFGDFQNGAKSAGFVLRGGYHNLVRGDAASMKRQVAWFRSELDRYGCHWAMVDIERYSELVSNGLWPRWDDVRRFRDAWHAVEDRPLAYYLPKWLFDGYYSGADLRELPGPLIQSHYAGGDGTAQQIYAAAGGDTGTGWDDRYGSRLPDIWQFTSSGNVPGASGNTDCNAYRGILSELAALLTGDDMNLSDPVFTETMPDGTKIVRTVGECLRMTFIRTGYIGNTFTAEVRQRLDAILAAAQDDGDTTVVLAPEALAELTAVRDAVAAVPAETVEALGAKLSA